MAHLTTRQVTPGSGARVDSGVPVTTGEESAVPDAAVLEAELGAGAFWAVTTLPLASVLTGGEPGSRAPPALPGDNAVAGDVGGTGVAAVTVTMPDGAGAPAEEPVNAADDGGWICGLVC